MKETRKLGLSGFHPLADGGFQRFVGESFVIRQRSSQHDSEKTEISQGERESVPAAFGGDQTMTYSLCLCGSCRGVTFTHHKSCKCHRSLTTAICPASARLLSIYSRQLAEKSQRLLIFLVMKKRFFPLYPDMAHLHIYRACSSEFNMGFLFFDSPPFWKPVLRLNSSSFNGKFPNNDQKYLLPL